MKKKPVAARLQPHLNFHAKRITKKVMTVVMSMSMVTAMP